MRTPPARTPLATLLLGALLAAGTPVTHDALAAAAPDSLPSLDDLAGPASTRFT